MVQRESFSVSNSFEESASYPIDPLFFNLWNIWNQGVGTEDEDPHRVRPTQMPRCLTVAHTVIHKYLNAKVEENPDLVPWLKSDVVPDLTYG